MIVSSIDWLSFSFHPEHLYQFLSSFMKPVAKSEQKSRFYHHVLVGEGFALSRFPRNKNLYPFMCEVSGVGCREFGGQSLLEVCRPVVKFNRVDVAWDFFSAPGSLEPMIWSEEVHPLRGQEITTYEVDSEFSGWTSGKTEFRVRYYDKAREQGFTPQGEWEWWRLEVAIRGDLCKVQDWTQPYETALGLLRRRFEHPVFARLGEPGVVAPRPRATPPSEDVAVQRKLNRIRRTVSQLQAQGLEIYLHEKGVDYEVDVFGCN